MFQARSAPLVQKFSGIYFKEFEIDKNEVEYADIQVFGTFALSTSTFTSTEIVFYNLLHNGRKHGTFDNLVRFKVLW